VFQHWTIGGLCGVDPPVGASMGYLPQHWRGLFLMNYTPSSTRTIPRLISCEPLCL
jgi:hypothetical protein